MSALAYQHRMPAACGHFGVFALSRPYDIPEDACSVCGWDRPAHVARGSNGLGAVLAPTVETEHCHGSPYYCDPAVWGCSCDCADCTAVRAS